MGGGGGAKIRGKNKKNLMGVILTDPQIAKTLVRPMLWPSLAEQAGEGAQFAIASENIADGMPQ